MSFSETATVTMTDRKLLQGFLFTRFLDLLFTFLFSVIIFLVFFKTLFHCLYLFSETAKQSIRSIVKEIELQAQDHQRRAQPQMN